MDVAVDEGLFDAILITLAEEGGSAAHSDLVAILSELYPDEFKLESFETVIKHMVAEGHITPGKGGKWSLATG